MKRVFQLIASLHIYNLLRNIIQTSHLKKTLIAYFTFAKTIFFANTEINAYCRKTLFSLITMDTDFYTKVWYN